MNQVQRRCAISWLLSSVMVVLCTATFMYQAGLQVRNYLEYGHQSIITEVKRRDLVFPSVTVCSNSCFRINKKSEACLKTPRLCTKFSQEVTFAIFRAQYEPEMRELVGYKPQEIFECLMESTSSECRSFSCVDQYYCYKHTKNNNHAFFNYVILNFSIRITFLRLPIMLCYTIDSTLYGGPDNMLEKCSAPWLYELRIRLRFIEKNTLRLMSLLPFPVFVQRPQLCQPERNAAIALVPQKSYDIAIKQQTKRRLPSPFTSRCKDYVSEGVKDEFYGFSSQESCTQTCLMKKEMELCSCHMSDHEYSATFKGRICDLLEGSK
ncbi:uncharacterized protein [Dermacentor andersoni]|uniref:uncharacterized protein n=1 Tax=Dermacentor andersoni TaxID=34620 RepID=UPI002415BE42|nr:uncharacterized protein LOC126532210 [Dermacentor andersoni]